jgi:hypothetical protein
VNCTQALEKQQLRVSPAVPGSTSPSVQSSSPRIKTPAQHVHTAQSARAASLTSVPHIPLRDIDAEARAAIDAAFTEVLKSPLTSPHGSPHSSPKAPRRAAKRVAGAFSVPAVAAAQHSESTERASLRDQKDTTTSSGTGIAANAPASSPTLDKLAHAEQGESRVLHSLSRVLMWYCVALRAIQKLCDAEKADLAELRANKERESKALEELRGLTAVRVCRCVVCAVMTVTVVVVVVVVVVSARAAAFGGTRGALSVGCWRRRRCWRCCDAARQQGMSPHALSCSN